MRPPVRPVLNLQRERPEQDVADRRTHAHAAPIQNGVICSAMTMSTPSNSTPPAATTAGVRLGFWPSCAAGRCQKLDKRRRAARRQDEAQPRAGDQAADVGHVVDVRAGRKADHQVDHDQDSDLTGECARLSRERRLMDPDRHEDEAEQPEDRPAGTHRRRRVEQVAGDRAAQAREQVDRDVRGAAVERLRERADDPQRIHVQAQVDEAGVRQRHGQQRQYSPCEHGVLVEQQQVAHLVAQRARAVQDEEADDRRYGDDRVGRVRREHAGSGTAEVARRCALVAHFLVQPAKTRLDRRELVGRCARLCLAIGARGGDVIALANARARQLHPCLP